MRDTLYRWGSTKFLYYQGLIKRRGHATRDVRTYSASLDSRPLSIEKDGLVYTACACVICPKNLGDRDILVN